jgi:hypothetical protein
MVPKDATRLTGIDALKAHAYILKRRIARERRTDGYASPYDIKTLADLEELLKQYNERVLGLGPEVVSTEDLTKHKGAEVGISPPKTVQGSIMVGGPSPPRQSASGAEGAEVGISPPRQSASGAEGVAMAEGITDAIRTTALEEKDATRKSMIPPIIVSTGAANGRGVNPQSNAADSVNFQYQTDLAKTFESVFDMILEKNTRLGIT